MHCCASSDNSYCCWHTCTLLAAVQTYSKVVFIKEAITEETANNMIALSLHLDSQDQKRIYYWLNCPGGEVSVCFVVCDAKTDAF